MAFCIGNGSENAEYKGLAGTCPNVIPYQS